MDRRPDSDDDRPPLPSVPPPPLSPSNTPPPTPATPSPHRSDSPAQGRKDSRGALCHPEVPTIKVCSSTGELISRPKSKDGPLAFSGDPILEIIQSRNPPEQTEEQSNSSDFNLDLDNFSRELMNVFEDLDAKIIAHQKASDGLCFALLPKSLRTKTSTVVGDQKLSKKIVDSQNYIVTPGSSGSQLRHSDLEIADDSSDSKETEDPRNMSNESKGNPADCDVKFSVKERAVPSPARKFEDELAPQKFTPPSLNRSSSFSNSITRKSEKLPGTIFNQSYRQDHHHHHHQDHHQHEQSHKRSESFDRSNINYMLYNSNDVNRIDDSQNNNNKNSKINNNNFNKYKSASLNNDIRNGLKANPSPDISTQNAQTPKQQKSGFQSFCSRLKQRSAPNRNVYRQYVRQVIDTAPKLDGYDSDIGGNGHNNFYGSLCSSPVTSPESTRQPKLSDGAPVNIFGTVRKHPQEARGIGHAFRNIRNLFSSTTGKQDDTRLANYASQKELNGAKGTPIKTADHSFRGAENRPQTERNHMETSYFPFNDSTLRRRTSFQSLLNVFNKPAEVHQSTWKSRIDNGNLACDLPIEPRVDPYPTRSTKDREGSNPWDAGGYGNLTSSKRFVSCLEIRLGK